ncbi:MAG: Holliday junction branch migration protein RuvA [Candidatus Magasanikbacteria bacterium]|nr:Holliday junction branch migration protein RuvA [Candidatus Magasanikbacteria bacterium]
MIGFLSGVVLEKNAHGILLETASGVGYEVTVTPRVVAEFVVGSSIRLYTYLKVSDSAQELFGFPNTAARDFFKLLLTVSGVGPKSALTILSLGEIDQIQAAIGRGDLAYLTGVQGMGKKTAERLVVELKTKLQNVVSVQGESVTGSTESLGDIIEALVSMGYSPVEARATVQQLHTQTTNSEGLLREALKLLAR